MEFLSSFAGALRFGALNTAWVFVVLWGFERLWPRDEIPSVAERLRALQYWALTLIAGAAFAVASTMLKGETRPLFSIPVYQTVMASPFKWAIYIIGPLAFVTVYDFFNYWMHRAQHKWFWRQHSIHHSIEKLSSVNSYFHWTEDLFRIAFITVPMTTILGVSAGGATVAAAIINALHGNYVHSPTKINFGPLGKLIVDNRYHRIHHSVEPQHSDKNFGAAVTLWDWLFGTAHFPKSGEWPETGVPGQASPKSLGDYALRPFRQVRGYAAAGTVKPLSEA